MHASDLPTPVSRLARLAGWAPSRRAVLARCLREQRAWERQGQAEPGSALALLDDHRAMLERKLAPQG